MSDPHTVHPPSFQRGEIGDPKLSAALRTLELTVKRKLDGVLQGDHLGPDPRPGFGAGGLPDVPAGRRRPPDGLVGHRAHPHPHVRQMIADRELETWLVVDMSASLDFGTTGCEKRDLAVAAAAAITYLNSGGGNRLGADHRQRRVRSCGCLPCPVASTNRRCCAPSPPAEGAAGGAR